MAGKAKKSTKKFEKNHLQDVLERRKTFAKVKQRNQLKEKKKARNAEYREEKAATVKEDPREKAKDEAFAEMNVDDFFAGGFQIPEKAAAKGNKAQSQAIAPKIGKRKRSVNGEELDDSASEAEVGGDMDVDGDIESGSKASSLGGFEEHKSHLEALKNNDPEFYRYLAENDAELLEFEDHGDLAEVDMLSESEGDDTRRTKKTKNQSEIDGEEKHGQLTIATVKKWKSLMEEQHSMRAMRQAVLAFRSAAYANDPESQNTKYTISDSELYHQVLITALELVPKGLAHHLPTKESTSGRIRPAYDPKKFKTLTPLIKSYTSSLLELLNSLSEAATMKLTLNSIEPMLPYLLQFRKLLKVMVKTIVGIWSDYSNTEAARIRAFLLIRRLMVIGDSGIRESVLKATYEGVVRSSRNTTVHTLPGINLTKNAAVEIWGIDQDISYTTGFTFIRQLAIHLRGSITNPSKDAYKTIYNWQFIHSLDFWSRVLSQHCDALTEAEAGKQSALRPLIYPVVQVTLGAMRLIPTPQYFPLRFQLTQSLLRISRTTGTYIPLAPGLLEVLNSTEMRKFPKSSTLKALDFETNIRAPKSYLRTRTYQDGLGEQITELLSEFFILWTKNIAFPELSLPVVVMLKRWLKEVGSRTSGNRNPKINQMILILVQKLESNSRWIEERRSKVTFAPRDRAEVESFLKEVNWETTPLGAFIKTQRKLKADRVALLERSRKEEERRRKEEKGEDEDGIMEDIDSDEDENVEEEESDDGSHSE